MRAFQEGDAQAAFDSATRLVQAYRQLAAEAAQLRFELNFGTRICEGCDGLKAGPGVVATCYQVRQCNFDNVKEDGGASPRQLRVLQSLLGDPNNFLTPKER